MALVPLHDKNLKAYLAGFNGRPLPAIFKDDPAAIEAWEVGRRDYGELLGVVGTEKKSRRR